MLRAGRKRSPWELELTRLRGLPRYQVTATEMLGYKIEIPDAASFVEMQDEIFGREMFAFPCQTASPRIVDGGANIGLVCLYYKTAFPNARVIAFEPDERIHATLVRNVRQWGLTDVEIFPFALGAEDRTLQFMVEGSYAGRVARDGDPTHTTVRAVRLRPWLNDKVDLLKLNIEGAETDVLLDCADLLGNVGFAIVEYHSFAHEPQKLSEVLRVLRDAGFRVHVNPVRAPLRQPFKNRDIVLGMDLQLAIYAYRP